MWRTLGEKVQQEMKKLQVAHMCSQCRTIHMATAEGGLRLLTVEEEFALRMEYDKAIAWAEENTFAPATNTGHLLMPDKLIDRGMQ